jgi:hypothetical protein
MWKCTESIILEDKFGVDHQFLKGHEYPSIEVNNTEKYIIERGINWIRHIPKNSYFLTKEQRDQYFTYVKQHYVTYSMGNPSQLQFAAAKFED